jgi:hypothetical protein
MQPYPVIPKDSTLEFLTEKAAYVQRLREEDIENFNNLKNIFISGRKVGKIPTSSTDITAGDRVGDFNYTASHLYIVVDDAGSGEWRRIALGVF